MAGIRIAQVGCGGMGLRHLYGQVEHSRVFGSFDLVALCDANRAAAEHVADEAEKAFGVRPAVYTDFGELLDRERPEAVDIVTDAGTHHTLAVQAFEAGVHVGVEKPIALTVRAGLEIMAAAERSGRVLSVHENYRRDPMMRLVKAILESGALGEPRLLLDVSTRGTRSMPHTTAWRHLKHRGGYLLDYAVHNADLHMYFMGEIETVYAETALWETVRLVDGPELRSLADMYRHRVQEDIERAGSVEVDSEDMAVVVTRFMSGAIGQMTQTIAAPGEGIATDVLYCAEGSIRLPGARSGRPVIVTRADGDGPLPPEAALEMVPGFRLDDQTAPLFDGRRRLASYDLDSRQTDAKNIAIELEDFARSILDRRTPEVTGQIGLDAVALVYAILESGLARRPVSFAEIVEDRLNDYQTAANDHIGL